MVTAVENDDVEALERLLQRGADVNANLDDDIGMNAPALQTYRAVLYSRPAVTRPTKTNTKTSK